MGRKNKSKTAKAQEDESSNATENAQVVVRRCCFLKTCKSTNNLRACARCKVFQGTPKSPLEPSQDLV